MTEPVKPVSQHVSRAKHIGYLKTLPLVDALWWYIENITTDHPHSSEYFFYLRKRYRKEGQPK